MAIDTRINILPDSVKHMIAAGEVVEGPASVIKELLENSLDAGSSRIVIEAEESGFRSITVRDDGSGIHKEDLPLTITEHATSKIQSFSDISSVMSLGFRGEALSSIAAVAELTLLSRRKEEQVGGRLEVRSGVPRISDFAGAKGTTVIIENLFYNVPARKKFQKSIQGESRLIRETVLRSALSFFKTGFELSVNGRQVFSLDAAASLADRISQITGKDDFAHLSYETVSDISVRVEGFISKPAHMKASRAEQYLFVNGRPVEMKHFSFLLSRAFESSAPQGRYPAAYIFVEIKPELVDVNIHPAKREVKFFDLRYVEGLIYALVRKTVSSQAQEFSIAEYASPSASASIPLPQSVPSDAGDTRPASYDNVSYADSPRPLSADAVYSIRDVRPAFSFTQKQVSPADDQEMFPAEYAVLGQLFGTYILAQRDEELVIVDFHAAHERINYDRLMNADDDVERQPLVFPSVIELPPARYAAALEMLDDMNTAGFDAEIFSDSSIIVRAVPAMLGDISVDSFFEDMLHAYGVSENRAAERKKLVYSRIACHASRRRNDALSNEEMSSLLSCVFSGRHDLVCPHGRPYLYTVKQSDFEKLFKR